MINSILHQKLRIKSINTRIVFWFCFVWLVSMGIMCGILYVRNTSSLVKGEGDRLKTLRDLRAREINAWLDSVSFGLKVQANRQDIRSQVGTFCQSGDSDEGERQSLRSLLRSGQGSSGVFSDLYIVCASSGKTVVSSPEAERSHEPQQFPPLQETFRAGDVFFKAPYLSRSSNTTVLTASVPLFSAADSQRPCGILAAHIVLERTLFHDLFHGIGLGQTGEVVLTNSDLFVFNKLRGYDGTPLRLRLDESYTRQAVKGESGVIEGTDQRGQSVLAAYTRIARPGWALVVKKDFDEILSPLRWTLLLIALLLTGLGGMVFLSSYFIARGVSGPLAHITAVSRRIREGKDDARSRIGGEDEFSELSYAIDSMTDFILAQLDVQKRSLEVIETMVSTLSLEEFSKSVLRKLMELTESNLGAFYVLSRDGSEFNHLTSIGLDPETMAAFQAESFEGEFGRALATRRVAITKNVSGQSLLKLRTIIGDVLPSEIMTIPVIVENRSVALISLASLSEFSGEILQILDLVRPVMSTAFSNIMASEETKRLASELSDKNQLLEAQKDALEAQAEELRRQSEKVKRQNIELEQQRLRVEEANKLKSEFLSNMSHELRTPLNSILALSKVLLAQAGSRLNEDEAGYMRIINQNGGKLLSLINDILDLSKIEAGRIDLKPKRIQIRSIIGIIVDNLEQIAEEKNIAITLNVPRELPEIVTDESRVYQILQNIIGNAVKFTEEGGVTITVSADGRAVRIVVEDTGIGIAEKDLPHIFEEFRQIDGTLTRKYDGTGLGLAIASKSAKLIAGRIRAQSTLNRGSVFTVELPLLWHDQFAPVSDESIEDIPAVYQAGDRREDVMSAPGNEALPGEDLPRLLIVDDDRDNITTLRAILKNRYALIEARDGKSGLETAFRERPLLILLDMALPEMSGFTVASRLKTNPSTARIPIIAVTALSMTGDRERVMQAGCDDYISKPYSIEELLSKIEQWLNGDHA